MNSLPSRAARVFVFLLLVMPLPLHSAPLTPNPAPLLNPITPAAIAPAGPSFTLTVTGTGFVSGSVVEWNGSARPTTFVSEGKLTAAISASDILLPATVTITVVSPAPGGGVSNTQFFQVTEQKLQPQWSSRDVTGQVSLTSSVVEGDFNNDGKLDLAVALGSNVYVLLGNGNGTFQSAIGSRGSTSGTVTGIHVADVNNDGKLDLIISGSNGNAHAFVATLFGNGNGTFQAPVESDFAGVIPPSAVVADFNGDGILDLAYVNATSAQMLLGNGDGTFRAGPSSPLNYVGLNAIAAGDFNSDGKLDLVVTVYDAFTTGYDFVGVMPGNGDGSFSALLPVAGSGTSDVGAITAAVGDFNGDGNLDIATGIQTVGKNIQGFIQIALGKGDGTFQAATFVPNVNLVTAPLLVADFNGDGNLDLATGGYFYYGAGNGTFPTSDGSSGAPTFVLAGDVNGDGLLDVIDEKIKIDHNSNVRNDPERFRSHVDIGLEIQIPPLPDFGGMVSPLSSVLAPGESTSFTITIDPLYGFTGDVTLSMTNLPGGVSASFNPGVVTGGSGSSTITLTASDPVDIGVFPVTLTGSSGTITHSTTFPLTVDLSVGDFGGYVAQSTQNIAPGGTATYSITTTPVGGFNGNVSLNVTGLPAGANASFSPATIVGGNGSSTLTVTTDLTTPQPQVSNLSVTATCGLLVHTTTVYLGVSASGGDFTGSITSSQSVSSSAGGTAAYNINLSPINGGAGDIALTVSGLPGSSTAVFTPGAIPGSSGSSTLNVTVPIGTTPGTYTLLINLSGAGVFHQDGVTLVVTP